MIASSFCAIPTCLPAGFLASLATQVQTVAVGWQGARTRLFPVLVRLDGFP